MTLVSRFAPSPTGLLHLGHAHAALFAWQAAQAAGGRFLLRIEDIDRQRCSRCYEEALLIDLAWLGLCWETPVRRQSEHFETYQAARGRLEALGVLYPCFCSRKDIQEAGGAPHLGAEGESGPRYPGRCRALTAGERADRIATGRPYAWRLDAARALALTGPLVWHDRVAGAQTVTLEAVDDVVLARKDTPTSYHLSVVVDDALQGVTLVSRGTDLFQASHCHRLLQALLGLPSPDYHHHSLLLGADGRRLSKRDGALSLQALREADHTPGAVRTMAGFN